MLITITIGVNGCVTKTDRLIRLKSKHVGNFWFNVSQMAIIQLQSDAEAANASGAAAGAGDTGPGVVPLPPVPAAAASSAAAAVGPELLTGDQSCTSTDQSTVSFDDNCSL